MLISSFLGLGVGAMLAGRVRSLIGWFPTLLFLDVLALLVCRYALLPTGVDEQRFYSAQTGWKSYLVLVAIFGLNSVVFLPLGQAIGDFFSRMPALKAYAWDLGGSLVGTVTFGIFSLFWFSPVSGIAVVLLIALACSSRRVTLINLPIAIFAVWGMSLTIDPGAIWSPYYYITIASTEAPDRPAGPPPADLRTRLDPPMYQVRVNQDFYQMHGTIDTSRYSPEKARAIGIQELRDQYLLPYSLSSGPERVAVVGAGGGMDVEAALLSGAQQVDAVEIDPVIVSVSRRYAASGVYDDPRVAVRIDDARAFLQSGKPGYDMIVFGFLDSQALFSAMVNIRLDGFTYTVESFRASDRLLGAGGMLVVSFAAGEEWVKTKLVEMLTHGTGRNPIAFEDGVQVILCVPTRAPEHVPSHLGRFTRVMIPSMPTEASVPPPATDDWPYLYLSRRTVPSDYRAVLGVMLALSIAAVVALRGRHFGATDAQMLFLGWGFLLLQTKAIGDCSLYFGTTWVVTMLVVAGVLGMVLVANAMATTLIRGVPAWPYAPLFVTLAILALVPREQVLSWPYAARLAWTLMAVPLPILFAGLIFSSTFRSGRDTAALFGANLIGAVLGGFCEYLGMAIGSSRLTWFVFAAYSASLACHVVTRRNHVAVTSGRRVAAGVATLVVAAALTSVVNP
jgi:hypothetical protein